MIAINKEMMINHEKITAIKSDGYLVHIKMNSGTEMTIVNNEDTKMLINEIEKQNLQLPHCLNCD
jgi:hypothetical protein